MLIVRAPSEPPNTSTHTASSGMPNRARAAARSVDGAGTGRPVTRKRGSSRPSIGNARHTRRANRASSRFVSPRCESASVSTSGTRRSTAASPTGPAT